jgi:hypothetical protein
MRLFTTTSTPAGFTLTAPLSMPAHRRSVLGGRRAAASAASTAASGARAQRNTPDPAFTTLRLLGVSGSTASANDNRYFSVAMDDKVRVLRRDVGDRARIVLSGRMADVCAALEHMSRAETMSLAG